MAVAVMAHPLAEQASMCALSLSELSAQTLRQLGLPMPTQEQGDGAAAAAKAATGELHSESLEVIS